MPEEFVFIRPWWLLLIPVGILLCVLIVRSSGDSWKRVCDADLLPYMIISGSKVSNGLLILAILFGWIMAVFALAGPAWDKEKTALYQATDALVVVFDLSLSMNATDVRPSRIERARYKAIELIEADSNRAVGLVVFAGNAFDVTPVSDDIATVTHLLQAVHTGVMPVQGSNASSGLIRAEQLLHGSGYSTGSVTLVTDGIDEAAFSAARALRKNGYRLSVVAVGTDKGAPVINHDGAFLKNSAGDLIVATVDMESLAKLAVTGAGTFTIVSDQNTETKQARLFDSAVELLNTEDDQVSTVNWNDRGPWLLIALIPIAALMFRRGWLLAVCLLFFPVHPDVHAFEWKDFWFRADQQAAGAVQQKNYDDAVISQFSDWSGIAHYRTHQFDQAAREFSKKRDKVSIYNYGNTLAQMGDIAGAVAQYEAAIELDPEFEDAIFNRDLLQEAMQRNEQQMEGESRDFGAESNSDVDNRDDELEGIQGGQENSDLENRQKEGDTTQRSGRQSLGQELSDEEQDNVTNQDSEENTLLQANLDEELNQVMEQWLRQIPDDPGGLLRRKFYFENSLLREASVPGQPW